MSLAATKFCDWRTFIETTEGVTPPDMIAALDEYFSHFAESAAKCLKCGEPLGGWTGTFRWGLAHGEGACSACGWPARAHHFIKDKDGRDLCSLRNFILQYHPKFVTKKRKRKAA